MRGEVEIVEVSPRDGLQNEERLLETPAKVELVERVIAAGVRRVEATSFVHPRHVPQMADAEAVMAGVPRGRGVSYSGLVLNRRGFERAVAAEVDEINFVVVATDAFNRRNQGVSTAESLAAWEEIAGLAARARVRTTVTVGAAFGCPFTGEVAAARVAEIARRVADTAPDEIALADTIGVAVPTQVEERLAAVADVAPGIPLRLHLHNTRNTGYANAYAAVRVGVRALDASAGGIGGCPFAPAATGNVATEDLVWMLDRMGVATGVEAGAMAETGDWVGTRLGTQVPALLGRAGLFPPRSGAR